MINLPTPPQFRGLDPDLPVTMYHRQLPHWRQAGATYFVTFRLADALPQEKLQFLKRLRDEWERTHPPPHTERDWEDYARQVTSKAEAWLDEGYGACHLREPRWANDLQERLLHFQDVRYFVSCSVIMPNHCHAVIRPFDAFPLETLLQSMKGLVARHINADIEQSGAVWQEESCDRIIRDEEHLYRVVQYIGRNPSQAGLPRAGWYRWLHPDWEACGWKFEDAFAS